jgi:hypothetical protein
VLCAALLGYAAFLAFHVGAYAGQSDSSGYLNSARLLAHGETAVAQRIPPPHAPESFEWFTFIPLGFTPLPHGRMAPTYPIGLPLLLATTATVTSWTLAAPLVMVASALLAVALLIQLGRAAGLPHTWSIFGSLLFAASPLTTFMSIQLMSDIPATAAATATILCAWRGRDDLRWAALAGLVFAVAVLMRPNNLILLVPVALCLGLDVRRWLQFALGGLPGAFALLTYNYAAYGHPLASGYGGDLASKFSRAIVPETLTHYARWLPILLTPVGLFALALPWFGRRQRFAWVLITWIAVTFAFYAAYWHTHETWWYLRFLLPAFPPCLIGGLWVIHQLWQRLTLPRLRTVLVARSLTVAATVVVLAHAARWHFKLDAATIGYGESVYPETCAWARQNLPADAVIVAQQTSGAFFYYTTFPLVRWDTLKPERFARLAAALGPRPLFAVLFPHEVPDALKLNTTGIWTQVGAVRHVTIWRWAPTAP